MSETNRTLRVRTNIGEDKYIPVNLTSEYDTLEILSLKINQKGAYRYHTSTYGVVVGRVLANNGFGVPNAKLSLFIAKDEKADVIENAIYPYVNVSSKNHEGIRYNLLPSNQKDDCHQVVGTFPNKRMILDDNSVIEVFDKYYLYTTKTNESGDYMFFGVPTGSYNLHMDLDISDCGKLSQRPRDFIYKGYNIDQFENPSQFKIDKELSTLPQIFSQDTTIEVKPFWGDEQEGTNIGITREDINVNYKFEPTCVFMGSLISDTPNDGINKRCVPTNRMGDMRELVTGPGTIEIIRKTINNTVEELQIKGKQLINGNGVWCFQIPMNLDYITTDEYGNIVPTDNPNKGIPTRCEVRFRMSMDENEADSLQYKRGKILVPNNPSNPNNIDYEFGSKTLDESFKSLMWNGVYSVKSFIPRFQKARNITTNKFTGIKNVNIHGSNNPMPYNNIRIKIPFMFWLMCNIVKLFIRIITIINKLKRGLMGGALGLVNMPYAYLSNEICPDLEYWYFAPGMNTSRPANTILRRFFKWLFGESSECKKWQHESVCLTFKEIYDSLKDDLNGYNEEIFYQFLGKENDDKPKILTQTEFKNQITGGGSVLDSTVSGFTMPNSKNFDNDYRKKSNWMKISEDAASASPKDKFSTEANNILKDIEPKIKLTPDVDYLMQCVEMNLAQEYEVIKFDFYNDWVNGVLYFPRWSRQVKFVRKRKNGKKTVVEKVKGCMDGKSRQLIARRYVQQCSLQYNGTMDVVSDYGCGYSWVKTITGKSALLCHKKTGADMVPVFQKKGGVVHEHETMLGDKVYYMEPFEEDKPMFATDIIMLGSLSDCNEYGIISSFDSLVSTTYKLPTNLALTNVDDDSYSYIDNGSDDKDYSGPPKLKEISGWTCNSTCTLDRLAASGATKSILSYEQLYNMMEEQGDLLGIDNSDKNIVIDYEDIFPVTEMSGIEWGYTGPDQLEPDDNKGKLFAPGGHFMGLACGKAETNIRSCVNLKRACEIGTTFSERLEIPIGFRNNPDDENFDIVNYLFVSPNGLISKDQVVDVTYRSIFATLNQNSLRTIIDPVTKHKKYDFKYLIPDSFDGSLYKKISGIASYDTRIPLEWDEYWNKITDKEKYKEFWDDILIEQGYTINRNTETKSNDYILFRHGDEKNFLKEISSSKRSMPVYKNSFYFYFGLKEGYTALDEFKTQFLGACAKSTIVGKEGKVEYQTTKHDIGFIYDIDIFTSNLTNPLTYELKSGDNILYTGTTESKDFSIENVSIGEYTLTIEDSKGVISIKNVEVGVNDFTVNYNTASIKHYQEKEERNTIDGFSGSRENGGNIEGDFEVSVLNPINDNIYKASIKYLGGDGIEIIKGDNNWNKLYDETKNLLWFIGYGTYQVYINELIDGEITDTYKYGEFIVNDGIGVPTVYIGNFEYKTEYNVQTIEEAKKLDYNIYRSIVNTNDLGTTPSFNLNFNCKGENQELFTPIFAGKPENGDTILNEVRLTSELYGSWKLNNNAIKLPSTYVNDEGIIRGPFYYNAYNDDNKLFAYNEGSGKGTVVDEKLTITVAKAGYYCAIYGGEEFLEYIPNDGGTLEIESAEFYEGEEVYYCKMLPCSTFVYPFIFRMAIVLDENDKFLIGDNNTLTFSNVAYLQSYSNKLYFTKTSQQDDEILTVRDTNSSIGNGLTKEFENILFGKPEFIYSHEVGNKIIFTLMKVNESLKNIAEYYLVYDDECQLQKNGTFKVNNINDYDYENHIITHKKLTEEINSGIIEFKYEVQNMGDINKKDVWVFGKVNETYGEYNPDQLYNNYCECHIMKPMGSLSSMQIQNVFKGGVKLINPYKNTSDYELFKYENNVISKIDKVGNESEYSFTTLDLQVKMGDNTQECIIATYNNTFRNGVINTYSFNQEEYLNTHKTLQDIMYTEFTTIFSQEEINNGDDTLYKIIFNYGSDFVMNKVTSEPEVISDDGYEIVIAAIDNNGNIIGNTLLANNAEILLSYNNLVNNLKEFKILYVKL